MGRVQWDRTGCACVTAHTPGVPVAHLVADCADPEAKILIATSFWVMIDSPVSISDGPSSSQLKPISDVQGPEKELSATDPM